MLTPSPPLSDRGDITEPTPTSPPPWKPWPGRRDTMIGWDTEWSVTIGAETINYNWCVVRQRIYPTHWQHQLQRIQNRSIILLNHKSNYGLDKCEEWLVGLKYLTVLEFSPTLCISLIFFVVLSLFGLLQLPQRFYVKMIISKNKRVKKKS